MQPRLIRLRDAPSYLGMEKKRFNADVRPSLTAVPIGVQGVAFDRLDLDAWVDQYKQCYGRPGANRRHIWERSMYPDCKKSVRLGTSIRKSTDAEFAKVLEQIISKKLKNT